MLRCAICLNYLPEVGTQYAHLIDSTSVGAEQVSLAVSLGILSDGYRRNSGINGMVQCPTCHIGFFTPRLIALSPALPILQYLLHYITNTPPANQMPLHKVFDLFQQAMTGTHVALPDLNHLLPYLGLFALVILRPGDVLGRRISTQHLPELSILQNNQFEAAPNGTSPMDENVARIFDVLAVSANSPPISPSVVPLSPEDPEFEQRRHWRLPVSFGAVLAVLLSHIGMAEYESEEITCAQDIGAILLQQRNARTLPRSRRGAGPSRGGGGFSGNEGPSSGNHGPGDGEPSGEKRHLRSSSRTESSSKRGRTTGGPHDEPGGKDAVRSHAIEAGEPKLSDRSASPQKTHHGVHPEDWEVASSFSTVTNDESMRTRSRSEDSVRRSSKSESEGGPGDPSTWQFGPSYRSDMIIVAARGISLVSCL